MSGPSPAAPVTDVPSVASSPQRTLSRLFLTLFLRGRSARGVKKGGAPDSVAKKLGMTLGFYALFGLVALGFLRQPVFVLSTYVHAMTFVFLGMFVATSAGEVLFNKEEADILLHRPVTPRALLWAKVAMLVQISLWLAGAFNLAALIGGVFASDGGWLFLPVHAISMAMEALFCTACVVLTYQLCLRWFGRERLDALMTATQVIVSVGFVLGAQLLPQLLLRVGARYTLNVHSWWVALVPPAWFAGFDDALAGSHARESLVLAALALGATTTVVWLAFGRLAADYGRGLQSIGEANVPRPRRTGRRWLEVLVTMPPLKWWLRDPVARASFLLSAAYLLRDRDMKLRVYPGIAPMLVMPIIMMLPGRNHGGDGGFGIAFGGTYLGLVPLLAINMLEHSQQWQAADVFRLVPIPGPAPLTHGARRAVLCLLAAPLMLVFGVIALLLGSTLPKLALLLPGLIVLPVYSLVPCLGGNAVPLSVATEEAKSTSRGLSMMAVMAVSAALAGISIWAWSTGWYRWWLVAETVIAMAVYASMRAAVARAPWPKLG